MKHPNIIVTKPIGYWNAIIKVNYKELFTSLTKAIIGFYTLNPYEGVKELVEALKSLAIDEDIPGSAYKLIFTSLIESSYDIIEDNKTTFTKLPSKEITTLKEYNYFIDEVDKKFENINLTIDHNFFVSPLAIKGYNEYKLIFYEWLIILGYEQSDARILVSKFDSYFIFNLNNEWRKNYTKYNILFEYLNTPFTKASQNQIEWNTYLSSLKKMIIEPVFDEVFGLNDIYVPLRGYYSKRDSNSFLNIVVDLESHIMEWIHSDLPENELKIISGGPGSGKSSAAKIIASKIVDRNDANILFIPLQYFNVKDDLLSGIEDFVMSQGSFSFNPLKNIHSSNKKLIIIFDGLDELSKQGKYANEVANQFIIEIFRNLALINRNKTSLKVLITGRELSVQSQSHHIRKEGSIIHLLPYYVIEKEIFDNSVELLETDQRLEWWDKYTHASNKESSGYPDYLIDDRYDEITSQPLLCYLVALSFFRNKINFAEEVSLNQIYEDLIKSVYARKYEIEIHSSIKELNFTEDAFFRILEEIAIAAWHSGDIRSTTIREINSHIEENNLQNLFIEFQKNAETGIIRLLTAFYFRQKSIDSDQNKTFEFTHKSFGEYLVSRRLVSAIQLISKKIRENQTSPDEGFDIMEALKRIIKLTGYNNIDWYLFEFIKNEIFLKDKQLVSAWQEDLIKLIHHSLYKGLPLEKITPRNNAFKEEMRINRNTEEALFVLLYCCSLKTEKQSEIDWPTQFSLSELVSRLKINDSSVVDDETSISRHCLGNQIYSDLFLTSTDLTHANFTNCEFRGVVFAGSDLFAANFTGSTIISCNFYRASLQSVIFKNTRFIYEDNDKKFCYLTIEQLTEVDTLENVSGFPEQVMRMFEHKFPLLLNPQKGIHTEEKINYMKHRTLLFK